MDQIYEELKQRHYPENVKILSARVEVYDKIEGCRVGDYLEYFDGSVRRIAHHWGDAVQPTSYTGDSGSFYFGKGYVSYSGGLAPSIPIAQLEATPNTCHGTVWFFDMDHSRAHGGVYFLAPFRIFRVKAL